MKKFGLIAEGQTDQIIISNILSGFFNNFDINPRPLLPLLDETDKNSVENFSNWELVLKYCSSQKFKEAFQLIDYLIVQIDTDTCDHPNYGIDKTIADTNPEKLIEKVYEKLQGLIGTDFYNLYAEKIIFAVSVHEIECWLLPLYCESKKKNSIKGCLDKLQSELNKQGINYSGKNCDCYNDISRKFLKHKVLMSHFSLNPSLKKFIEELQNRNIDLE